VRPTFGEENTHLVRARHTVPLAFRTNVPYFFVRPYLYNETTVLLFEILQWWNDETHSIVAYSYFFRCHDLTFGIPW
jgi:hypothetical protein